MNAIWLASFLTLSFSGMAQSNQPAAGVSLDLARARAHQIRDVKYELELRIPRPAKEPIAGQIEISFHSAGKGPVDLDFQQAAAALKSVTVNGETIPANIESGHIRLPNVRNGMNAVKIEFSAGEAGIHRRDDFLYTLFVPENASKTIPCFDQPDLKARYKLTLVIPKEWTAVSQTAATANAEMGETRRIEFGESEPTSTYLIAFAAGKFQTVTRKSGGREMTLYHRESDPSKVNRNLDAIFDLHAKSIAWMENYTGVKFPFEKFDFVALPAFPFGGMEHPGSIFYNDKFIFLDESATRSDYLNRAQLIAHETAHAWFGDLVTMRWFDDVWLKEVFATFMGDKIADPLFPDINHDLRFFLRLYPSAYSVDRTAGTNPIQQDLKNLRDASSLYGGIIYSKAPIVMRQLEKQVGEERFQAGLKRYLNKFRFGNATWADLIAIMGGKALAGWNDAWVVKSGRPSISISVKGAGGKSELQVDSEDPLGNKRVWPQAFTILLKSGETIGRVPVRLEKENASVKVDVGQPEWILRDAKEPGYGLFTLDPGTKLYLLQHIENLPDENLRAVAWLDLRENMYEKFITPEEFIGAALRALPKETQELTIDFVLGNMRYAYWALTSRKFREALAPKIEQAFWERVNDKQLSLTARLAYFKAYQSMFLTNPAWKNLHDIWSGRKTIRDFHFSELDEMAMAYALALRKSDAWADLEKRQMKKLKDPERAAEFSFVMAATKGPAEDRDAFFARLLTDEGRKNEPWVRDALAMLHHPLRGPHSEIYVPRALELLPHTKQTGGIFFPLDWLNGNLAYHVSPPGRRMVEAYLKAHADLEPGLRLKLLQASDTIMRFAKD